MVEGKPDIDKVALIRAVRQFEVLYNCDADGYTNKTEKDLVWDKVVLMIWPKYKFCGGKIKDNMRANVKRRWKTLRNTMAKEVKKVMTNQNYVRKDNILLDEMEFLVPHIKSIAPGQSRYSNNSFGQEASINEATEDDDMDDTVDLTDDYDTKPYVKMESDIHEAEYECGMYPIAELGNGGDDTSRPTTNTSERYDDHRLYDDYDNSNSVHQNFCDSTNDPMQSADSPSAKRPRIENGDGYDADNNAAFQKKVIQLISNIESRRDKPEPEKPKEDAPDEDRMFLLSLVSDLRRVPASRKMLVKAEIATVIARGMT